MYLQGNKHINLPEHFLKQRKHNFTSLQPQTRNPEVLLGRSAHTNTLVSIAIRLMRGLCVVSVIPTKV